MVISKSPHRYVYEFQYRDPEKSLAEADYECMQDTDQEQPTTQLEMSDDHIPIPERKWKDLISNALSFRYTSESQISKVVCKIVRHKKWPRQKQMEQFIGNFIAEAHNYVPKGWKP